MSIHNLLVNYAFKYKDNAFIKALFGRLYHNYLVQRDQRFHKKERLNFKKNALEALSVFNKCMNDNGFSYTLATGTLLGAIREKGFIAHDEDIDVFMWIEDYRTELIHKLSDVDIQLRQSYSIDNDKLGKEDSFIYKGVQIDIFYIYPKLDRYPYFTDYFPFHDAPNSNLSIKKHGGLMPRRIQIPIRKEIIKVPFESLYLPVPINSNEVLEARYGKDYMTPRTNWTAGEYNPNVTEWPEKTGVVNNKF